MRTYHPNQPQACPPSNIRLLSALLFGLTRICFLFSLTPWLPTPTQAAPVTHQARLQLIEVAEDDGSNPATTITSRLPSIEAHIDQIWEQAGVDVRFEPTLFRLNHSLSLRGEGPTPRPVGDLENVIIPSAKSQSAWHTNPAVLNLFFVDVVPGFNAVNGESARGQAVVAHSGIACSLSPALLESPSGRAELARLIAHEIGHNLGLLHPDFSPNLMNPANLNTDLTQEQINAIFSTSSILDFNLAIIPPGGTRLLIPSENRPPSLNPIADQSILEGDTLVLATTAADPDQPLDTLLFSLDPGEPDGAAIEPTTGIFNWTPTEIQGPSTNTITVRVTDSGTPPLSSTQTFLVLVLAAPRILSFSYAPPGFTLCWETHPGKTYHLQYTRQLAQARWENLLPAIVAEGTTATATDPLPPEQQRFYRILQLD